jgi:hypothetical protein
VSGWPRGVTVKPLGSRPFPQTETAPGDRRYSPFQASWARTCQDLDRELDHLTRFLATLLVDLDDSMLRRDGDLRANASMWSPRVILLTRGELQGVEHDLTYACDAFTSWQANVRAIALGLHDLRRLDRYGIAQRGAQYGGWAQLPPGTAGGDGSNMTVDQAGALLAGLLGIPTGGTVIDAWPSMKSDLYRRAARKAHPDAGGSDEEFKRVEQARLVLDREVG